MCGVCVTFEASPRSKRHERGRRDLACERECLDIDLLPRMETLSYRLVAIDGYRWLWLGGSLSSRSTSRVSDCSKWLWLTNGAISGPLIWEQEGACLAIESSS